MKELRKLFVHLLALCAEFGHHFRAQSLPQELELLLCVAVYRLQLSLIMGREAKTNEGAARTTHEMQTNIRRCGESSFHSFKVPV